MKHLPDPGHNSVCLSVGTGGIVNKPLHQGLIYQEKGSVYIGKGRMVNKPRL